MEPNQLQELKDAINTPFYTDFGFWIGFIIGVISIVFSYFAFREAKAAKTAAYQAGVVVKIQTVTIELSELIQKLENIDLNLDFRDARERLGYVTRKLSRLVTPFRKDTDIEAVVTNLLTALREATDSLNELNPTSNNQNAPHSVYYAMQAHFLTINQLIAELMGLFEKTNIEGNVA